MGVLIIVGTVTLVVLIVQRMGAVVGHQSAFQQSGPQHAGGQRAGLGAGPEAEADSWPMTDLALGQPPGSHIAGIVGAEGRLAIWVQRPDGDKVLLVDPRQGRITGEIGLGAAAH